MNGEVNGSSTPKSLSLSRKLVDTIDRTTKRKVYIFISFIFFHFILFSACLEIRCYLGIRFLSKTLFTLKNSELQRFRHWGRHVLFHLKQMLIVLNEEYIPIGFFSQS